MPTSIQWIEYLKLVAAFGAGGLGGAIFNNIIADRKNKTQPVTKKVTISYVNLPTALKGYDASITLKAKGSEPEIEPVYFQKLAVVRIELVNSGNKDIDIYSAPHI